MEQRAGQGCATGLQEAAAAASPRPAAARGMQRGGEGVASLSCRGWGRGVLAGVTATSLLLEVGDEDEEGERTGGAVGLALLTRGKGR